MYKPNTFSPKTLLYCILFLYLTSNNVIISTENPVIGILAQEYGFAKKLFEPDYSNYTSYIAASYIKQVEASGAKVVPILIGKNAEYYANILSQINGVVLPGGAAPFDKPNGYAEASRHILKFANQLNKNGEVFPILAVCLGFELIIEITNNNIPTREKCGVGVIDVNLKLDFLPGYSKSSIFSMIPRKDIYKLANTNITHNHHIYCIEMGDMIKYKLVDEWNVLTTSCYKSYNFISTVEHKKYPYLGIQYHPEKNAFEWKQSQNHVHTYDSKVIARYFYDWLINTAQLNNHSFPSRTDLYNSVIQNYDCYITAKQNIGFDETYFFK